MKRQDDSTKWFGRWTMLCAAALLLAPGFCAWRGLVRGSPARAVVIHIGTNGVPRVFGFGFGNKVVRNAAFSAIARSRAPVHLEWQSPGGNRTARKPLAQGGATPAQLEVLHALAKAGITNCTFSAR